MRRIEIMTPTTRNDIVNGWERVAMAIDRVRERLRKSTEALATAGVPYAVIGGNAVAEWVGRIDDGAVRFTKDVDILLRRSDLARAIEAMQGAGFTHHHTFGVDMFLDGPSTKASEAVHVIFALEKVKESDLHATPDVNDSEQGTFRVLSLEALVQMKLTSFRDKDRTHVRDMIGVGLIDRSWIQRVPQVLSQRLAAIFDSPEG
jgi:hypothetical protein